MVENSDRWQKLIQFYIPKQYKLALHNYWEVCVRANLTVNFLFYEVVIQINCLDNARLSNKIETRGLRATTKQRFFIRIRKLKMQPPYLMSSVILFF